MDTPKELLKDFKKFSKKLKRDKKLAKEFWLATGIWDKNGELTNNYKD